MSTASMITDQPVNVEDRKSKDDFPVVLHYVRKTNIAESAVLGTTMRALCGQNWEADETDYAETANPNPGPNRSVVCPMCADMYTNLPAI